MTMEITMTENQESQLEARDDRVSRTIYQALYDKQVRAAELRDEALRVERQAAVIERAVLAGRWWELEGVLTSDDIESLSNVHLSDTSAYLKPIGV